MMSMSMLRMILRAVGIKRRSLIGARVMKSLGTPDTTSPRDTKKRMIGGWKKSRPKSQDGKAGQERVKIGGRRILERAIKRQTGMMTAVGQNGRQKAPRTIVITQKKSRGRARKISLTVVTIAAVIGGRSHNIVV